MHVTSYKLDTLKTLLVTFYLHCLQKDVVVFRFDAPLCFVNIGVFRTRLIMAAHLDKEPLKSDGGCIQTLVHKLQPYRGLQNYDEDASSEILGHREDRSVVFLYAYILLSTHFYKCNAVTRYTYNVSIA